MVKVIVDDTDLRSMVVKLSNASREMKNKVTKAINNGLKKAKPFAESTTAATYNVAPPSLEIKASGLDGYLKASGPMNPVSAFHPVSTGARIGQVVSVEIIRGSRKPILPSSRGPGISGAFMIPDGRVMERRQDEKYPIFPVSTIGYPQMVGSRKVSNPVRDMMAEEIRTLIAQTWLAGF